MNCTPRTILRRPFTIERCFCIAYVANGPSLVSGVYRLSLGSSNQEYPLCMSTYDEKTSSTLSPFENVNLRSVT